jgi:simple sugar transport system permease protein
MSKVVRYVVNGVRSIIPRLLSVLLAFAFATVLILYMGKDPLTAYGSIVSGALGTPYRISQTLLRVTPLLIGASGILIARRAAAFNIGGVGQLYMGAIFAGVVACWLPLSGLGVLHAILSTIAALAGGALVAAFAAYLRLKFGANLTIVNVMLNEIVVLFLAYLMLYPPPLGLRDPTVITQRSPYMPSTSMLPLLGFHQVHFGTIMALLLVPITYIILEKSVLGYRFRIVGANPRAAEAAGISVKKYFTYALVLSGALMGLVGYNEMHIYEMLQGGMGGLYGVKVLSVAGLGGSAVGVLISALFFGTLAAGADFMQSVTGVPAFITAAIDGFVLLFILLAPKWGGLYSEISKRILNRGGEKV